MSHTIPFFSLFSWFFCHESCHCLGTRIPYWREYGPTVADPPWISRANCDGNSWWRFSFFCFASIYIRVGVLRVVPSFFRVFPFSLRVYVSLVLHFSLSPRVECLSIFVWIGREFLRILRATFSSNFSSLSTLFFFLRKENKRLLSEWFLKDCWRLLNNPGGILCDTKRTSWLIR